MTPQELKNSILQLAIQGKLVEQRSEEDTAEELFARIQAEKQRLIKEGKIKKEKPLPEITEDEKPFDIPESWKWVRVGSCGSWGSGATPDRTNSKYYGGTVPWLKTGDLNDSVITEIPEYITELALEKTSVRLNPIGSVLMAMYGATIGKLGILGIEATTNQACCACIPYEGVYNKFLFYFLLASRNAFIKMGEGGAQPNISKEKIVNALIPLPPLAEQKRIVAKIEELLPYIDRYEQAWSKLEQFNKRFPEDMKKSLLQYAIQGKLVEQRPEEGTAEELYTQIQAEKQRLIKEGKIKKEKPLPEITEHEKPFDIPESWKWVRLGTVSAVQSNKRVFEKDYVSDGIPFFRSKEIGDLYRGEEIQTQLFITQEHYEQLKKDYGVPQIGDILITSVGTIGNTWICDGREFYYKDGNITQICSNEFMYPRFLQFYIESPLFLEQAHTTVSGTAYNALTIIKLKQMMLPLPPLAEQKRIVEKLEQLLPLCERLK